MKKCKRCQTEIDVKATKCPHCQTDQRNFIKKHPILTVIGVLFVVGFLVTLGKTPTPMDTTPTVKQEKTADVTTAPTGIADPTNPQPTTTSVPTEYKSALYQATSYANTMHMSKRGVYAQLVSEYGGQFSPEAAQYAIDNVQADWNANALAKAKTYQDTMKMSPAAIRDQLISEYGEKFTQAEADFAIQHLND